MQISFEIEFQLFICIVSLMMKLVILIDDSTLVFCTRKKQKRKRKRKEKLATGSSNLLEVRENKVNLCVAAMTTQVYFADITYAIVPTNSQVYEGDRADDHSFHVP